MKYAILKEGTRILNTNTNEVGTVITDSRDRAYSERIVWADYNGWKAWTFRSSVSEIILK